MRRSYQAGGRNTGGDGPLLKLMELSVVIVSYNVCDLLRHALQSLITPACETDQEIIVVDNNSADHSAEMVKREFPGIILITSGTNEGYAAACNRGIMASSGNFILILNPDTLVDPEAIPRALAFMKNHPDAGAAGAHMTDGEGRFLPESKRGFPSPMTSLFRFTGLGRLFPRSAFFNAYYLGNKPEDQTCRADILTGAFMLIRREALDRAGLFDTRFFMYGEDIDLSWRIRKAGFNNYYLHDVHITHFKGKSSEQERERSLTHFYEAMTIFAEKHLARAWHIPVRAAVSLLRSLAMTRLRHGPGAKK
ncbi:MAG: glycosyltransferase family 2 protein [Bacteroidales bacterium]|nr:glycosyltransferase family 2 protein [Bacteroidales bacterium]MCB9027602.1 glycosyltransferase family 2 protein [Bacteroidales bacterium]NLD63235.1 glycosyltransferase family 2 protein [Bacteroidales bacterium]HNT93469.1 glycosyltransferase family 2 protein [Bacteroidales bacterium]HOO65414.1 glycosyltransferase family 2 protein [Bacteroidales bacterium]